MFNLFDRPQLLQQLHELLSQVVVWAVCVVILSLRDRLLRLRGTKNYQQKHIADLLCISLRQYQRVEGGEIDNPHFALMQSITDIEQIILYSASVPYQKQLQDWQATQEMLASAKGKGDRLPTSLLALAHEAKRKITLLKMLINLDDPDVKRKRHYVKKTPDRLLRSIHLQIK